MYELKQFSYFLIFCGYIVMDSYSMTKPGVIWEYCQKDSFSPHCNDDEVIIMEHARYGHIQISRCIDTDLGHFGCESDQLYLLDRKCSGRQSCDIYVASIDDEMNKQLPCTTALSRYLEAEYKCQVVYQLDIPTCQESKKVSVKARMQYLSSSSSIGTDCGMERNPWILEANPGQQINISVTDFNWKEDDKSKISHPCPIRYGYIIDIDLNEAKDLCGGTSRQKHVHLSKGSSLQVIVEEDILLTNNFLLSYQAVGCPTFTPPVDTRVKQNNDVVTVGCNHNSNTWKMRCIGNNWIGIAGKCEKEVNRETDQIRSNDKNRLLLGMPSVVTFTIIGGVFLVIICVTVTFIIGIFCIKKTKDTDRSHGYFGSPIFYDHQQNIPMSNIYPSYRPIVNSSENNQTLVSVRRNDAVQSNNADISNDTLSQKYYVLERDDAQQQSEAIYDVVYQNA